MPSQATAPESRIAHAITSIAHASGAPDSSLAKVCPTCRVHYPAEFKIYAVGAILYCAVTEQRPFERGDPTATLTAVLLFVIGLAAVGGALELQEGERRRRA